MRREEGEKGRRGGEREEGKVKEEGKLVPVMDPRVDEDNANDGDGLIKVAGIS